MSITSQKTVLNKLSEGLKLEVYKRHNSEHYYLTDYKYTEINVAKNVIEKLKEKGLIDSDNDYKPKTT